MLERWSLRHIFFRSSDLSINITPLKDDCIRETSDEMDWLFLYSPIAYANLIKRHKFGIFNVLDSSGCNVMSALVCLNFGVRSRQLVISTRSNFILDKRFWSIIDVIVNIQKSTSILVEFIGGRDMPTDYKRFTPKDLHRAEFYVMDPDYSEGMLSYSQNHRRNIRRALSEEMKPFSLPTKSAMGVHLELWSESMNRRQDRGEPVAEPSGIDSIRRFLRSGLGRFVQFGKNDQILASAFLVEYGVSCVYYKAGANTEGMRLGAAHFLIHETAKDLLVRGFKIFNLGIAAANNEGLRRFKAGFGANAIPIVRIYV
ncbi:MAG: GNAT family N-acetyltransferase [Alphaproteobacteria bacterium]